MALSGTRTMDMTKGNPMRTIMAFSVPFIFGNVFQMLYNTVDTMVVGRFVGSQALAAVGGAGISYNVVMMLINGFMNGASVVVAQAFGSNNREAVRKGYATSCLLIAATGIIFTILGEWLALPLLRILKTPEDVIDGSLLYLRVMYIGIIATGLYNGFAAFLRAVGDSRTPLVALIIATCLNVVLDLFFVLALKMGIAGVALATIISQAISGFYCRQRMHKRIPELLPAKGEFSIDPEAAKEMVRIGLPAAFSSAVVTFSVMLIQRAVNSYGSTVLAAYTAEEKVGQICYSLSYSIGVATGVFIGQNKGAGLTDRVKEGLKAGTVITLVYHAVVTVIILIFSRQMISIFTVDEAVIDIAVEILRITAIASPLLGLNFVFQNFLRNVSDVKPTIWMSCAEVASRGTLPYVLGARFGYRGIWLATPIGWLLSFLIGFWRYLSGKWCSS